MLLSVSSNLVARIVSSRLSQWSEAWLCEEQAGFRRGRGTDDALQVARRIIEEATRLRSGDEIHMTFFHREKAYPRVCRPAAWQVLRRSAVAYDATPGLAEHPGKTLSAVTHAIALGAELDGEAGLVGAPRGKRLVLAGIPAAIGGGSMLRRLPPARVPVDLPGLLRAIVRVVFFEHVYSLLEGGGRQRRLDGAQVGPEVAVEILAMWLASRRRWRPDPLRGWFPVSSAAMPVR